MCIYIYIYTELYRYTHDIYLYYKPSNSSKFAAPADEKSVKDGPGFRGRNWGWMDEHEHSRWDNANY